MRHKAKTARAIENARSLLAWEELLGQLLSLIIHGKRDDKDITHLESIIEDLLAGKSISGPDYTPSTPADIGSHFIRRMTSHTPGQRRKYLQYLIRIFGIQGVSAMFYNVLSTRTYNCMISAPSYIKDLKPFSGFHFAPLDSITTLTRADLCKVRNVGRTAVREVQRALELFGLSLGMARSDVDAIFRPEPKKSQ